MTATQRHGDCEVVTTMRGRLAATCPYPNLSSATLSPDVALRFAEAEARRAVSEALAPREASPKLEAAERSLRKVAALDESQWDYPVKRDIGYSRQIASELDRIRATVARLETENANLKRDSLKLIAQATHGTQQPAGKSAYEIISARLKELEAMALQAVRP